MSYAEAQLLLQTLRSAINSRTEKTHPRRRSMGRYSTPNFISTCPNRLPKKTHRNTTPYRKPWRNTTLHGILFTVSCNSTKSNGRRKDGSCAFWKYKQSMVYSHSNTLHSQKQQWQTIRFPNFRSWIMNYKLFPQVLKGHTSHLQDSETVPTWSAQSLRNDKITIDNVADNGEQIINFIPSN